MSPKSDSAFVLQAGLIAQDVAARASGIVAMIWPDGVATDSVVMTLGLRPEPVTQAITCARGMAPIRFAVFYLAVPEETPALPVRDDDIPRYPEENESHRVAGQLAMQFVVDTAGRRPRRRSAISGRRMRRD